MKNIAREFYLITNSEMIKILNGTKHRRIEMVGYNNDKNYQGFQNKNTTGEIINQQFYLNCPVFTNTSNS